MNVTQRHNWLTLVILAGLAGIGSAAVIPPGVEDTKVEGTAVLQRLKTLVGTWEAPTPTGGKATTIFELTAGGSVLLERYSNTSMPGGGHMVTAYHLDGRALVLTHYCIAKNQPTLRAERYDAASGELQFEFVRAGNLASENAGHMRRAKYVFLGPDTFRTEWEFFQNGKKTMTEVETFSRVKTQ
jgi:hypothetical protein